MTDTIQEPNVPEYLQKYKYDPAVLRLSEIEKLEKGFLTAVERYGYNSGNVFENANNGMLEWMAQKEFIGMCLGVVSELLHERKKEQQRDERGEY